VTLTPRPYQIEGRDFLASRQFALLADEMRVGKTPQAILACEKVDARRVLVVCPAIATAHWDREFDKWLSAGPEMTTLIVSYDKAKIQAKEILAQHWDVAIVDEAHFAKNPQAARTKLIYGKGGIGWCSDHLWALSGTPAPKHAGELWPMLYAFGVTRMDYVNFIRRYCRIDWMSQRPVGTLEERAPEINALVEQVMLRRMRKEVAPDMPDIDYQFLTITPTGKADFDEHCVREIELGRVPTASDDRLAVAMAKVLPLVDEIDFAISNSLLRQTVVFGWHVEPLVALARQLANADLRVGLITGKTSAASREQIQREFREGTVQVVVANILAAGTAIDLSAASHGYFLELDWVPGNNVQAANRLISMDKIEKVTMDVCTWPGSVDDRIQKVLLRRVRELSKLY
jgi:SWI/SNF-related matrix-associated actin-dependent regulator of chromatin subfamily A-like protein 1